MLKNQEFIKNFEITNDCLEVLYDAETFKILAFYLIARSNNYYSKLSTYIKITPEFDTIVEIYPRIRISKEKEFDLQTEIKKSIDFIKNNTEIKNDESLIPKGFFGWNFEQNDSFDGYYYEVDGQLVCKKADGRINYSYESNKLEKSKIYEWFGEKTEKIFKFFMEYNFDKYMLISKKIDGNYKGQLLMHFEDEKIKNAIEKELPISDEVQKRIKSVIKIC